MPSSYLNEDYSNRCRTNGLIAVQELRGCLSVELHLSQDNYLSVYRADRGGAVISRRPCVAVKMAVISANRGRQQIREIERLEPTIRSVCD